MTEDSFLWPGSPPGDAPPPPAPRRRGRVGALAAVALLVAAAVALALALSGGSAGPLNAVAQAADATDAQAGYRFALNIDVSVAGVSQQISATGVVRTRPQVAASMRMTVAGQSVDAVLVRPWEYIRAGSSWIKINTDAFQQAIGSGASTPAGSGDPAQLLRFLRATGTVTRVGSEAVNGVSATHYRAITELDRYAATVPAAERAAATTALTTLERELGGITTLPIDAWIDAQHRVRRIVMTLSALCTASGPAQETMTMDFTDYGPQQAPVVPSDALDVTGELAPKGGPPASPPACTA